MSASAIARALPWAGALCLAACGGHGASADTPAGQLAGADSSASASAAIHDGDWTTFDYGSARSGVGPADTGITSSNARSLRTRTVHIDGVADSAAVQLHAVRFGRRSRDVAVLTTTYGKTIAIDPGTGTKLWEFVPGDIGSYEGSSQITTASPVADPNRRYVYVATPDGLIRKLAIASGHQVQATRITFDASREKIAGALNISGRYVVAVTGGYYGDAPTYQGHVVLIDRGSGRVAHVWNALCSNRRHLIDPPSSCPESASAIWGRSGAVIEPGSGRILIATGNGAFDGHTYWGDSVLELSSDASRLLHNWTPVNQAQLNSSDTDVGSTAPALLPATGGFRLAVQGGKDGNLYLLNLNRLDGTRGAAGPRTGGELGRISSPGGGEVLTAPAVWSHGGRTYVFVANDSGTTAYVLGGGHQPRLSVAWENGTSGTSPVVAGGLLYVYDRAGGTLAIRRPTSGGLVASLPADGGHWSSPIVVGGRVILPVGGSTANNATSGKVFIYHLPGR